MKTYYFKELLIEVISEYIFVYPSIKPVHLTDCLIHKHPGLEATLRTGAASGYSIPEDVFKVYPGLEQLLKMLG